MDKKYIIINNVKVYKNNIQKVMVGKYYTHYMFNNGTKYVEGNILYNSRNKKCPFGYNE
jgi:hypothetical protein